MAVPRRVSDRVILYGAVAGALVTISGALAWTSKAYVRLEDAVETVPQHSEAIQEMGDRQDAIDERLSNIEWWVEQVGKKMGIPPPPKRQRYHARRFGR